MANLVRVIKNKKNNLDVRLYDDNTIECDISNKNYGVITIKTFKIHARDCINEDLRSTYRQKENAWSIYFYNENEPTSEKDSIFHRWYPGIKCRLEMSKNKENYFDLLNYKSYYELFLKAKN